ncbi:hypothetical protein Scep_027928 [Stephania cephalantha]|uniref:Uncharacterized protein n=1 Tax=Stephania cephalantha TaxID=152367 RepID=A0AAP0HLK9_9MAGN
MASWLDEQEEGSVVYLIFGSRTAMSREQMRELGEGLVRSGHKFLWVVEGKKVDREDEEAVGEVVGGGQGIEEAVAEGVSDGYPSMQDSFLDSVVVFEGSFGTGNRLSGEHASKERKADELTQSRPDTPINETELYLSVVECDDKGRTYGLGWTPSRSQRRHATAGGDGGRARDGDGAGSSGLFLLLMSPSSFCGGTSKRCIHTFFGLCTITLYPKISCERSKAS